MGNSNRDWQNIGIGIIILAIVGLIVRALFSGLNQAPWAFITVMAALLGTFISVGANLQIQARNAQGPAKAEIYDKLIKYLFDAAVPTPGREPKPPELLAETRSEITPELILWGSDDVLRLFIEFRQIGFTQTVNLNAQPPREPIVLFGEMLLAIRKDLGYSNRKIDERSILRTIINDSVLKELEGTQTQNP